jgi:HlyD family secretion protein
MKKLIIVIVAIAAFVALIVSQQIKGDSKALEVKVTAAEKGKIKDSILASGTLVFNTQVQLRSEVTGRVERVFVEEGQRVEKGDMLMQLDTEAFEAEVDRYKALVRQSEIDIERAQTRLKNLALQLKRQKELFDVGLSQQEVYDNIRNAKELAEIDVEARKESLNQAKASLSIAQDRLSKSVFRATMSGLLASVDIKEGETVIAGTTNIVGSDLMLLADPSKILAELKVDETDIASIKLDQEAEIFAAAYPNKPFIGRVIHIGTSAKQFAGSQGRSFKVKVLLNTDERTLYAGMSCRAEIATAIGNDAIKLPIEAVQDKDGGHYVWLLNEDLTVTKQTIELGVSSDIEQAIESGISEQQKVVIGPARAISKLKEGEKVKLNDDEKGVKDVSDRA